MKRLFAIPGILAVCIALSSCGGLLSSDQPAKRVYLLQPITLTSSPTPGEELPALILNLTSVPGLDTDRIIAVDADAQLYPYANARWPDFLPEVLSSVIRRSLLSSGQFQSVSLTTLPGNEVWSLTLEAQEFYGVQSIRGSTIQVNAEFDGLLNCQGGTHRLHLSATAPVGEERLAMVVKAHQQALDDITHQLWTGVRTHCE